MTIAPSTDETRDVWVRTESREVRPFRYAADYLSETSLRLQRDDPFVPDEVHHVEVIDSEALEPTVRLAMSTTAEMFQDLVGVALDDLLFIIVISDQFLMKSSIVYQCPLRDVVNGQEIVLHDEDGLLSSWRNEKAVDVAVVLQQDRTVALGNARRQGSWLARKSFRIARPVNVVAFPIHTEGSEWFKARGLPEGSTYLVEILTEELNQVTTTVEDIVQVTLSKSVFDALGTNPNSVASKAMMTAIYTDVVTSILFTGLRELVDDIVPGGFLDNVIERIKNRTGIPRDRIIAAGRERVDGELRAIVQSEAEFSHKLIEAVRRRTV